MKQTYIGYRDNIGIIAVYVNMQYAIDFCDGYCYFTGLDGNDYKIPVENLIHIETLEQGDLNA